MENLEPVFFNVEELRTLRINLWDKKDKLKSKVLNDNMLDKPSISFSS